VRERAGLPVTWLGPRLDDDGSRHTHVHACASCLDRPSPQPSPTPLIDWTGWPPPPEPTPELWIPMAATVLSCLSALCALATLLLAPA
jgi:hypothetical protein